MQERLYHLYEINDWIQKVGNNLQNDQLQVARKFLLKLYKAQHATKGGTVDTEWAKAKEERLQNFWNANGIKEFKDFVQKTQAQINEEEQNLKRVIIFILLGRVRKSIYVACGFMRISEIRI